MSLRIAGRAERIEPFYVMEVAKAASQMAPEVSRSDRPMVFLNIGEPDFTAPPLVQEAAERAIRAGTTQYTQATGMDALRERMSAAMDGRLPGLFGVEITSVSILSAFCSIAVYSRPATRRRPPPI